MTFICYCYYYYYNSYPFFSFRFFFNFLGYHSHTKAQESQVAKPQGCSSLA